MLSVGSYDYLSHCFIWINFQVGLVIGKGGETIKSMQATTGARIQVSWPEFFLQICYVDSCCQFS